MRKIHGTINGTKTMAWCVCRDLQARMKAYEYGELTRLTSFSYHMPCDLHAWWRNAEAVAATMAV